MKVDVTHCEITSDVSGVIATVELVDANVVQVNIKQVVGWGEWLELSDAVRKAMLLMGVEK